MKRTITSLAVAFALLVGAASCSQKEGGDEFNGEGTMKISFEMGVDKESKAGTNVKPKTGWSRNIKQMYVLVTNSAGKITYAQSLDVPAADNKLATSKTFTGVPAGQGCGIYIVANYDATSTPFDASGVGVTALPGVGSSLVGSNINNVLLNLKTVTPTVGDEDPLTNPKVMSQPSEIFLASRTGVEIKANQLNDYEASPLQLKRAVSMMRVFLNQNYTGVSTIGTYDNNLVDFQTSPASFRVRVNGDGLKYSGSVVNPAVDYNTIYSDKKFKLVTSLNSNDYLTAFPAMGDYKIVNEYIVLPGGGGAQKFNVVVFGTAKAGYIAKETDGTDYEVPVGQTKLVYWYGQVKESLLANNILELKIDLKTQGIVGPVVPPVDQYGDLKIGVELVDWGSVAEENLIW